MESVKAAIAQGLTARHGACVVRMDAADLCMKIYVEKCPDHIIHVRPNSAETRFECHYVHTGDVEERKCFHHVMLEEFGEEWLQHQKSKNESVKKNGLKESELIVCRCESAEMRKWRQHGKFRLSRVVKGTMKMFASIAVDYASDAIARIQMMEAVEGDELRTKRVKTFAEAQTEMERFPKPVKPPRALPEAVNRRNRNVFSKPPGSKNGAAADKSKSQSPRPQ